MTISRGSSLFHGERAVLTLGSPGWLATHRLHCADGTDSTLFTCPHSLRVGHAVQRTGPHSGYPWEQGEQDFCGGFAEAKGQEKPWLPGTRQEQVPAPVDLLLATRGHFLLPVRFLIPWFFSLN